MKIAKEKSAMTVLSSCTRAVKVLVNGGGGGGWLFFLVRFSLLSFVSVAEAENSGKPAQRREWMKMN